MQGRDGPIGPAWVFVLALAVLGAVAPVTARAATGDDATVRRMVAGIRQSRHLRTHKESSLASAIARRHSARMRDAGSVFHNTRLGAEATAAGLDWSTISENVGIGPSIQSVHDAFVASAVHLHNIVDTQYEYLGTGVARADDGWVYVTQVFLKKATRAAAPVRHGPAVRAEDHSAVPATFYAACATAPRAEDRTEVPGSFYGPGCNAKLRTR